MRCHAISNSGILEFRAELPKTLVGKVAYRILEEEELAKIAALSEEERNAVDPGTARKEEISLMAAQLEEDDVPVMEDAGNEKEE